MRFSTGVVGVPEGALQHLGGGGAVASIPESPQAMAASGSTTAEAIYAKLSPGPGRASSAVAAHQMGRICKAMIELTAQRGYKAVTVRELARRANVSSRAFYELYSGKEDCFTRTHELLVRRAAKSIVAAQAGETNWEERLRAAFRSFVEGLDRDAKAAWLVLIEAQNAGETAQERSRWAERIFTTILADILARGPETSSMSPLVSLGVISGTASVARSRVLWGKDEEDDDSDLGDELARWTLSCCRALINRQTHAPNKTTVTVPTVPTTDKPALNDGNRDLILSATIKLAAGRGSEKAWELAHICDTAGLSRRAFNAQFEDIEDCLIAAAESCAGRAFEQAGQARAQGRSWEDGVGLALRTLCKQVAYDPALANLAFIDVPELGSSGVYCCERFIAEISDLICRETPNEKCPDDLSVEASAGAIWGIMRQLVRAGRSEQLARAVPTLVSFALAPAH